MRKLPPEHPGGGTYDEARIVGRWLVKHFKVKVNVVQDGTSNFLVISTELMPKLLAEHHSYRYVTTFHPEGE